MSAAIIGVCFGIATILLSGLFSKLTKQYRFSIIIFGILIILVNVWDIIQYLIKNK